MFPTGPDGKAPALNFQSSGNAASLKEEEEVEAGTTDPDGTTPYSPVQLQNTAAAILAAQNSQTASLPSQQNVSPVPTPSTGYTSPSESAPNSALPSGRSLPSYTSDSDGTRSADATKQIKRRTGSSLSRSNSDSARSAPIHRWTEDETNALVEGCDKHGVGQWKAILTDETLKPRFQERTPGDLKDRFRTHFPVAYHELYPNATTHFSHSTRGQNAGGKTFVKGKAKERRAFTPVEDEAIKAGYEIHGSSWSTIAKDPVFQGLRRATDLRDRFRNAFPELYEQLGYKPRPNKPKKERRPSHNHKDTMAAAMPSLGTAASLARTDQQASGSADRIANLQSYSTSNSGDVSMSETSDTEHEADVALMRGGPFLGQNGRSMSFESAIQSGQQYRATVDPAMPQTGMPEMYQRPAVQHPRSSSGDLMSVSGAKYGRALESTPSALRRSQSSKRANPKISAFDTTPTLSNAVPYSARPGMAQSFSADHTPAYPWTPSDANPPLDFDQIIGQSASLLATQSSSTSDAMDVDMEDPSASSINRNWQNLTRSVDSTPPPGASSAATYSSLLGSDYSAASSASSKPRSSSHSHRQQQPMAKADADAMRERINVQAFLNSLGHPSTAGQWVWVPSGSANPSLGSAASGPPAPPPPSLPAVSYPLSHPFAGDLHVPDDLPNFVDLASMQFSFGPNPGDQLAGSTVPAAAPQSSSQPVGMSSSQPAMYAQDSVPVSQHSQHSLQYEGNSISPSNTAYGDDLAISSLAQSSRAVSSNSVPKLTADLPSQQSVYRSSAFSVDDLSLTVGNQTFWHPLDAMAMRRRRSTDTLGHGGGSFSFGDPTNASSFDLSNLSSQMMFPGGASGFGSRQRDTSEPLRTGTMHMSGDMTAKEDIMRDRSPSRYSLQHGGDGDGTTGGGDDHGSMAGSHASGSLHDHLSLSSNASTADMDPTYAVSLPDLSTSFGDDGSGSGMVSFQNQQQQQHSYDDIDLPSLLNRSPFRQPSDSHPLLSPRHLPLGFDLGAPALWSGGGGGGGAGTASGAGVHPHSHGARSASETNLDDKHGLAGEAVPKAWSDYGGGA